jgi:hypothetical protein
MLRIAHKRIEWAGVRSGSCRVGSFARDGFGVVGPTRARGKKGDSPGRTTPGVSHPRVPIQPRITSRRYRTLRPAKSSRRSGPTFDTFSDAPTAVRRWLWVEWVLRFPLIAEPSQNAAAPSRKPCSAGWPQPHDAVRSDTTSSHNAARAARPARVRARGARQATRPARIGKSRP